MTTAPEIKRLLVMRNDRVGDLVLTLPALAYARKALPAAEITVLAAKNTACLLEQNPHVDRLLIDDRSTSARQLARELKPFAFDAAAIVHTESRNCLAVWLAGIPTRVTWYYNPISRLLGNRWVTVHRSRPPIHESEFALAFIRRLHCDPLIEPTPPHIHLAGAVRDRVRGRLEYQLGRRGPLFGVHPGNYHSAPNWPSDRYLELVIRLAAVGCVVVTGGPGESELLESMRRKLPGSLRARVAFHHEFSLMELAAAISLQDVLTVSNTGPMHLGGVLGTPLVALFSADPVQSPAKWAPLGQRHTILKAPLLAGESPTVPRSKAWDHMCRIAVEEVVHANLRHLESAAA